MTKSFPAISMERKAVCAIGAPLAAVWISKLVFDWMVTFENIKQLNN